MSAKKYKLFSNSPTDGGTAAPCAFFGTEAGCKNGDNCKFLHSANPVVARPPAQEHAVVSGGDDDSSVVSSESSDGEIVEDNKNKVGGTTASEDMFLPPGQRAPHENPSVSPTRQQPQQNNEGAGAMANKDSKKSKRKRKKEMLSDAGNAGSEIFNHPKNTKDSEQKTPVSVKKEGENPPPAVGAPTQQHQSPVQKAHEMPTPKRQKSAHQQKKKHQPSAPAVASFRNLNLPITSFSIPIDDAQKVGQKDPNSTPPASPQHEPGAPSTKDEEANPQPPPRPLPRSTPEGRKWSDAVLATRSHRQYENTYNFTKYQQLDAEARRATASDWVQPRPYGPWCEGNPHAIAIDCEMCETSDPVTGQTDPKALCRISVVNAVNPDEVLLDTLVKPSWPVVDYRSRINGIKKEHLESVQFTLRHAQAFMMALCSDETVVLGHAVHNDLAALRMVHHTNVDSALLYTIKDEPGATPSLKDLAMSTLQRPMPETHDSVNDARTALCVLEHYAERGGKVEPIERTFPSRNRSRGGDGNDKLFVHRVPRVCQPSHLSAMFLAHTHIQPTNVAFIDFNAGSTGKTIVTFSSDQHAALAFDTLETEAKPDKTGRMQKRVYMKTGGYVQVREMVRSKGRSRSRSRSRNGGKDGQN